MNIYKGVDIIKCYDNEYYAQDFSKKNHSTTIYYKSEESLKKLLTMEK